MALSEAQKSFFANPYSDFWPFIESHDFERESIFLEMERQYEEEGIFSIGPWFGRFLNFLVRFGGANRVLEFGTASGYSAAWIAKGLPPDGMLVTIEKDPHCLRMARENIQKAEL